MHGKIGIMHCFDKCIINLFIAYGLSQRPLLHLYIYVIGLSPRASYIFSLDKDSM